MSEFDVSRKETNLTLAERLKLKRSASTIDTSKLSKLSTDNKIALLLDLSSSMNIEIEPGRSRFSALQEILMQMDLNQKPVFYFNDLVEPLLDKDRLPKPYGCTNMSLAFEYIKSKGIKEILMITDGEPNDPIKTLESAKGLKIRTIFVGTVKPTFLDKLAEQCGSACTIEDLKQPRQLAEKIQLLLDTVK